jgi:hypothetical protein
MDREDVPLGNYDRSICGDCKGYNGGCVGFAPHFSILKPSHKHLLVLSVEIDMAWAIMYAHDSGHPKQSNYFRLTYADRLTEAYLRRILGAIKDKLHGYPLGAGNCSGCGSVVGNKMCGVLIDGKCLHPDKRTFSMEATHIDCSVLCQQLLGRRLAWWYRDEIIPRYMNRFAGVLLMSDKIPDLESVYKADKACVDQSMPLMKEYALFSATAPEGCVDAGMEYDAYCMSCEGAEDEQ